MIAGNAVQATTKVKAVLGLPKLTKYNRPRLINH